MFVKIETNGASHIVINVPHNKANALAAIAAMFERNAAFMQCSYYDMKTVTPKLTIELSDRIEIGDDEGKFIIVNDREEVIDEEVQIAGPEVFMQFTQLKEKYRNDTSKLRQERDFYKQKSEGLEGEIKELMGEEK